MNPALLAIAAIALLVIVPLVFCETWAMPARACRMPLDLNQKSEFTRESRRSWPAPQVAPRDRSLAGLDPRTDRCTC